jgi:outer membrane receptor protein involved in Fe transport
MFAFVRTLGAGLSLLLCLLGGTALAQTYDKPLEISIPAGNLADALEKLGDQSGLQIMYEPAVAKGIRVAAVNGILTASDALTQLLARTGLQADRVNDKTVVLKRAEAEKEPEPAKKEKVQPSTANQPSEESSEKLEEIVVTAQKREEKLKDVPIAISVVTGAALDRSTLSGATDILNTLPNVNAAPNYQGGGTRIAIRGVGAQNAINVGANPIGFYLDGMPFSLVKHAFVPSPNVYDLDRIEVLRGPQGTLYGANAQNGVIRVLTHDADLNQYEVKARGLLSTTDGGGGNYGGDLAVNVPIVEGKLAVRAVAGYSDYEGWIDGASFVGRNINDSKSKNGRIKVNAQPTEQLSLALSAWTSRNTDDAPAGSDEHGDIADTLPQFIRTDYGLYGAKVEYEFAQASLSSTTSYLDFENDGLFDVGPYGPGFGGISARQIFSGHVLSEELVLNSRNTELWRWTAGAFYRDATDLYFQTLSVLPAPLIDNKYISESYAAFGEVSRRFLDRRLELTVGLRYFHDEISVDDFLAIPLSRVEEPFHATTPRAVLTWYQSTELTMYASYSQGFRSGFPQDPFVRRQTPQFPSASPDKLHNYEVGAKGNILDGLISFETALYYIDWKDVQQSVNIIFAGNLTYPAILNSASASGPGVEFAATMSPLDRLQIGASFAWNGLRLEDDVLVGGAVLFNEGDPLDSTSKYTAAVSGSYEFDLGGSGLGGRFSLGANYNSKQLLHPAAGAPALTGGDQVVANTQFSVLGARRNWTVSLFADNLTNERDAIVPGTAPGLAVRVRPRTIGTQFDYRF